MTTEKRNLIDRSRLLRDPYFQEDRYPESRLLRMAIMEQPTVDVVEVVQCKDCKNWRVHPIDGKLTLGKCAKLSRVMGDDGFCSYGERRITNDER